MSLIIKPSRVFKDQVKELPKDERHLVGEKLKLAQMNPYRYKSLRVPGLGKVFEIKITLQGTYRRIIYFLDKGEILVAGITNRKNDFDDLLALLYKTQQERRKQ